MTNLFTAIASLVALAFVVTTLMGVSALAGEPKAQKTLYVSTELEYLIKTAAMLPENSNFLLPDSIEGTTAELLQDRLIVQGETTLTPEFELPEGISTLDNNKVNLDFLYVSKIDDKVGLSSIRNDACLKLSNGNLKNSRFKINLEYYNEDQKKVLEEVSNNLNDRLKRLYSVADTGAFGITLVFGAKEEIILSKGTDREHSSFSCYLQKTLGWQMTAQDNVNSQISIVITENTDDNNVITMIVNALEDYYE